jgi:cell volume regulation protein A
MQSFSLSQSLESTVIGVSLLLILSAISSRASSWLGIPSLLLFLGIGMLAGSDGPGGIAFTNYPLAFGIGSVSLAIILFDGGLRTPFYNIRPVLSVGISLASLGVVATAALTGAFAILAFDLTLIESLLLGAIVSSTDAAAVFTILRSRRLALKGALKHVLEFEAGSNDPMAIFLTTAVLAFAVGHATDATTLSTIFVLQACIGLAAGWAGGRSMRWVINHIGMDYEGLYSVLVLSLVLFLFGITTALAGSGFLAVYVAGLVLGNLDFLHKRSLLRFHDGIAWIAQISLFLALGLLVFPSKLLDVWKEGLALSAFLMFIARPVSVLIAAPTSKLSMRERTFVSWVGLRGAAPIILATLPWSAGIPRAEYIFELVFFVVLISVIAQGVTIPWLARRLQLTEPLARCPPSAFVRQSGMNC